MAGLLFGTAGVPRSAFPGSTVGGIERIAGLGLDCMEVEFVRGVTLGEGGARLVAEAADRLGVRLSAHAPYFINLNSHQPEKIRASQERILQAAHIAYLCHARAVVFHAAFYLGDPRGEVYETTRKYLAEILRRLERENNPVLLRPELTGKPVQFGDIEEILSLSADLDRVAPCIDFSHWHARTGRQNSYPEFASVLRRIAERLGREALEDMHIHVSGIRYGQKGELKHLNFTESDFNYADLLRALRDAGAGGMVICESPNLEEDALLLKSFYHRL